MSPILRSLGIEHLSLDERISLVGELWDSIADEAANLPLGEEVQREIDRRLADHRADPASAIPWEQAEAEASARLGR